MEATVSGYTRGSITEADDKQEQLFSSDDFELSDYEDDSDLDVDAEHLAEELVLDDAEEQPDEHEDYAADDVDDFDTRFDATAAASASLVEPEITTASANVNLDHLIAFDIEPNHDHIEQAPADAKIDPSILFALRFLFTLACYDLASCWLWKKLAVSLSTFII
jgi:hypothetical protein